MTPNVATKQNRRRGIVFTVLIAITLLLMAFSGNPYLREAQRGFQFALTPFQEALASFADGVAGVATAITEIDQLRTDNSALREENERLANENARLRALKQENDELTALLQLQGGFDHQTVAARVIGRETLDTRRVVTLDKGTDDGLEMGDVVVVQGSALAGKVTDIGPTFVKVTLISDSTSTVVGKLLNSGETGDIVGQAGGVLIMRNVDSGVAVGIDEARCSGPALAVLERVAAVASGPTAIRRASVLGSASWTWSVRRERRGPYGVPGARFPPAPAGLAGVGITDYGVRRVHRSRARPCPWCPTCSSSGSHRAFRWFGRRSRGLPPAPALLPPPRPKRPRMPWHVGRLFDSMTFLDAIGAIWETLTAPLRGR